jgi:hypothetical protein
MTTTEHPEVKSTELILLAHPFMGIQSLSMTERDTLMQVARQLMRLESATPTGIDFCTMHRSLWTETDACCDFAATIGSSDVPCTRRPMFTMDDPT